MVLKLNTSHTDQRMKTLSDDAKLGFSARVILLLKIVLHGFQNTYYTSPKGAPGRNHEIVIFKTEEKMDQAVSLIGIIYGKSKQQVGLNI